MIRCTDAPVGRLFQTMTRNLKCINTPSICSNHPDIITTRSQISQNRGNPKDIQGYIGSVRAGLRRAQSSRGRVPQPTGGGASKTEITETILMNLRLLEGLDLDGFKKRFGASLEDLYGKELEKLSALGLIEILKGRLKLSENGLYLANKVFEEFV